MWLNTMQTWWPWYRRKVMEWNMACVFAIHHLHRHGNPLGASGPWLGEARMGTCSTSHQSPNTQTTILSSSCVSCSWTHNKCLTSVVLLDYYTLTFQFPAAILCNTASFLKWLKGIGDNFEKAVKPICQFNTILRKQCCDSSQCGMLLAGFHPLSEEPTPSRLQGRPADNLTFTSTLQGSWSPSGDVQHS